MRHTLWAMGFVVTSPLWISGIILETLGFCLLYLPNKMLRALEADES